MASYFITQGCIMFFKHTWPAFLFALIVLILCVIPGQDIPEVGIVNFDKLVHTALFALLTFLFAKGFYRQTSIFFLKQHFIIVPAVLCSLYGGLLEILQATVCINRAGDWLDFLFDTLGALVAAIVIITRKSIAAGW